MKNRGVNLIELFADRTYKAKARVAEISVQLMDGRLELDDLMTFAEHQTGTNKGTCIEAIEAATAQRPELASRRLLDFVTRALAEEEPRVKWEAAKVLANVAPGFTESLGPSVDALLGNADHTGTVVRWATATALAKIALSDDELGQRLLPEIEKLSAGEEDEGVKKKYSAAIKRLGRG